MCSSFNDLFRVNQVKLVTMQTGWHLRVLGSLGLQCGGWGGYAAKVSMERLHKEEVQTLTLLYNLFYRKVTPTVYLLFKKVPLSHASLLRALHPLEMNNSLMM